MCDTFVATPDITASGKMIFGKNSDREPNEAQCLVRFPARKHSSQTARITYRDIPQVKETYEILVSKPFHMWGAEMGANSKGVVIGNEAVFTKIRIEGKNNGLTGMDMIRVALERCQNSAEALELIVDLVERFGQDACGGYLNKKFFYHNSFIIADAKDAYVLETAGRFWAWKKIRGFYSISNGLTLESDYDDLHPDAIDYARSQGWLAKGATFSFRESFSDSFYTTFSKCKVRRDVTMREGNSAGEKMNIPKAMEILRLEGQGGPKSKVGGGPGGFPPRDSGFSPASSGMGSVCLHATGFITPNQTNGSFVAEIDIDSKRSQFWATGTSIPAISIFLPFSVPGMAASEGMIVQPGASPDTSLWWSHETLYRLCLRNYSDAISVFGAELKDVQESLLKKSQIILSKKGKGVSLDTLSEEAIAEAVRSYQKWRMQVAELAVKGRLFTRPWLAPLYRASWFLWNRKARITDSVLIGKDLPFEPAYL
ncbi:acyl-coenzyme A:6-aminopenicillanic acid acyl-transferase domain protein [Leptospira broomii serovar Hurstbridge str. 5399]|uniref:Acyl-coenzyme A:6-aminopenicillanic acid acyl-transferase domain protein n=1 Tax=Leptospira broomii serovar Hurstbridge str. 5399 TaxID=1049789 RepID=T0FEC7_9LEPT|nr:acyl-CoA--6-aminopenicillanic acid acyltransferase [Leptospira broomii]EQA46226.1 acyl-coenzyme A:6-aminopenicillanic acid acyl-transferase domain protein [Leptospira broomii serovar Hurstbridge str. 5399]